MDDIFGDQLPDFSSLTAPSSSDGIYLMPSPAPNSAPASSFSMPTAAQGLSAVSSIMSGIGGYMQGQETAQADEYNANLALMEGQFNVEQIGEEEHGTISTQKAMYSKAGVEMSGSPLDTALHTATQYEYSKQVATFNAQSQSNMYDYQAKVARQQGNFALGAGIAEAGIDIALAFL